MDEKLFKNCSSASPTRKRETEIMFEISSPPGLNGQDLFVKGQHVCMNVGKGNILFITSGSEISCNHYGIQRRGSSGNYHKIQFHHPWT